MRKLSFVIIIAFCLIFVPSRFADEGMWTFDNTPLKQWKEKYGFEPSREWLDRLFRRRLRYLHFSTPRSRHHILSRLRTREAGEDRTLFKMGLERRRRRRACDRPRVSRFDRA